VTSQIRSRIDYTNLYCRYGAYFAVAFDKEIRPHWRVFHRGLRIFGPPCIIAHAGAWHHAAASEKVIIARALASSPLRHRPCNLPINVLRQEQLWVQRPANLPQC